MIGTAQFSPCRRWRYLLTREWDATYKTVLWLMLNPSIGDATIDDPTLRRCMGFARAWGYGGIVVCNIFAYRSTDPAALYDLSPSVAIGPDNDATIDLMASALPFIVAAWGSHGALLGRGREVLARLPKEKTVWLGLTKNGEPRHPLYVPRTTLRDRFVLPERLTGKDATA